MQPTAVVPRRKLWDLVDFQCPVIGTCLTMAELRKLARKLKLDMQGGASDFELHSFFVYKCRTRNTLSQRVQKLLDKKFQRTIRQVAKAGDSRQLEAMWAEALAEGNIPGPFWAVLTHPEAGPGFINRVFGEIHMLSHMVGAANRADIRRLSRLETDLGAERERVDQLKGTLRRLGSKYQEHKRSSQREIADLRKENARLTDRLVLAESLQPLGRLREVEALNAMLREKAGLAQQQAAESASELRRLEVECKTLLGRVAFLEQELDERTEEVVSLESTLENALSASPCSTCGDAATCPKLSGKRILYVGGRTNLVQHYRTLVERSGGEFLHHDGGEECSLCVLGGALSRADCVLFPVDCVSHEACAHIKRMCRSTMKPFVPLRSSGLSSLARGLGEVAA